MRVGRPVLAPEDRAELGESPRVLEPRVGAVKERVGLREQRDGIARWAGEGPDAQRSRDRDRRAPAARERQQLVRQTDRVLDPSQPRTCFGRSPAPRDQPVLPTRCLVGLAAGQELPEGGLVVPLGQPQRRAGGC